MAPKKSNRQGQCSSSSWNSTKFIHADAEQRYLSALHNRGCTIERGVQVLEEGETGGIDFQQVTEEINRRGWNFLVNVPPPGCIPLVREFYANMLKEGEDGVPKDKIFLRNKWVWATPDKINEHLRLQPVEECAYTKMLGNPPSWDEVLDTIGRDGAEWTYYDNDSERTIPKHIKNIHLSELARVWAIIIMSRLRPCSHCHSIPKEPCLLLYCILSGMDVDVGMIISDHMRHIPSSRSKLPYPSLITELSRSAGVSIRASEERTNGEPLISPSIINLTLSRARRKVGRVANNNTGRPTLIEQAESSRVRTHQVSSSSQDPGVIALTSRIDALEVMVQGRLDRIERKVDQGFLHMDAMMRLAHPDLFRDYPPVFTPTPNKGNDPDDEEDGEEDGEEASSSNHSDGDGDENADDAMEDSD